MEGLSFWLLLPIFTAGLVILFLGRITLKKSGLRSVYLSLMTTFSIVNFCWLFGPEGMFGLDPSFYSLLGGSATIVTFPLATIMILMFLHPKNLGTKVFMVFSLMIPAFALGFWTYWSGIGAGQIYESQYVYIFVILCLCFGLMESIWGWLRTRTSRNQCYLFILAFLVLFATGPLYDYELEMLGFQGLKGASLGAPIVGAFLLTPLLLANPMTVEKTPFLTISKSRPSYDLKHGRCYGVSEKRPKYCYTFFKDLLDSGFPSLVLTSSNPGRLKTDREFLGATVIGLTNRDTSKTLKAANLGRALYTLADFAEKNRKPVILIDCLHYMFSNNDVMDVAELVQRLVEPIERNDGVLLVSFSLMTQDEKSLMKFVGVQDLRMPPPEDIIVKILTAHLGDLSSHLLKLSCRMMNKRICDFTVEDLPELSSIFAQSMRALGAATNEDAIQRNWDRQVKSIRNSLSSFQEAPIEFLTSDRWRDWDPLEKLKKPQRKRPGGRMTAGEMVRPVTLQTTHKRVDLHDAVSGVFAESLGDFGSDLFRMECANLGIEPEAMTREDVETLANIAASTISGMSGYVNIESVNDSMRLMAENLKKELGSIFKE